MRRSKMHAMIAVGILAFGVGCALPAMSSNVSNTAHAAINNAALLGGGSQSDGGEAFTWSDDCDCSQCHQKAVDSTSDANCLASKHASLTCVDCHEQDVASDGEARGASAAADAKSARGDVAGTAADTSNSLTMAQVHANVTNVKQVKLSSLRESSVSSVICLQCHDTAELAEATEDCTALKDVNGTVVNPHALPEGSQHSSIQCVDCHVMHANDSMAAYRTCVSCHHAEMWECGTCHSYTPGETADEVKAEMGGSASADTGK